VSGKDYKKMPERTAKILKEYKSLLVEAVGFYTEFENKERVKSYSLALEDLEDLLKTYETVPSTTPTPVAKRPDCGCNEKGMCIIKVENDAQLSNVPMQIDGEWTFGKKNSYAQNRECLNCGRCWTVSVREGRIGLAQETKGTSMVQL
jgi:hypothetical protein